jgi:hypothetical protein
MKYISLVIVLFLTVFKVSAQDLNFEASLDPMVKETSGLIYLNNTLITHNDSGNDPELYDIDTVTGLVKRTVTVTNATNTDWEDLTYDDTYIYIGDFGNNQGNRTDLKIYRIAIADYFSKTSVYAELINYSYGDQTDFSVNTYATNFDAEALIHYNNKLYIFSKIWMDGKTNVYELSKNPGTYSVFSSETIECNGLISGATYNSLDDSIMLCGYGGEGAFLIQLKDFSSGLFSNGTMIKTLVSIPENYSIQIEGITQVNTVDYYISSEGNSTVAAGLHSFNAEALNVDVFDDRSILFYPNPAEDSITINSDEVETEIYTITGQLIKTDAKKHIDISGLDNGIYLIKMKKPKSEHVTIKRLIIDN